MTSGNTLSNSASTSNSPTSARKTTSSSPASAEASHSSTASNPATGTASNQMPITVATPADAGRAPKPDVPKMSFSSIVVANSPPSTSPKVASASQSASIAPKTVVAPHGSASPTPSSGSSSQRTADGHDKRPSNPKKFTSTASSGHPRKSSPSTSASSAPPRTHSAPPNVVINDTSSGRSDSTPAAIARAGPEQKQTRKGPSIAAERIEDSNASWKAEGADMSVEKSKAAKTREEEEPVVTFKNPPKPQTTAPRQSDTQKEQPKADQKEQQVEAEPPQRAFREEPHARRAFMPDLRGPYRGHPLMMPPMRPYGIPPSTYFPPMAFPPPPHYMPFAPPPGVLYGSPMMTGIQTDTSPAKAAHLAAPPGISPVIPGFADSAAPQKARVEPPAKKIIKIINPETRAEVKVDKAPAASAAPSVAVPKSVSITTPAGQKVEIVSAKKDVRAHQVADLESQLASMHIEKPAAVDLATSDEEEGEVSDESEEEEDGVSGDYLLQRGQQLVYPEGVIPMTAPTGSDEPWRYPSDFLRQFQKHCTESNQAMRAVLQERFRQAHEMRVRERRPSGRRESRRSGAPHVEPIKLHRAEHAWTPATAAKLDATERLVREVRGILNKLTPEKFDPLFAQLMALGIMSEEVMTSVIGCIFDKAIDEPQFCPIYAKLCVQIVYTEAREHEARLRAQGITPGSSISEFRRLLITRCQDEYANKRAWSKKRIEMIMAKASGKDVVLKADEAKRPEDVGHLTDNDLMMIKLKRRVLGNVRFIGELFKTQLLSSKIMHSCVHELLSNIDNPEEEEIECLCRLLTTVGKLIDTSDSAEAWAQYIARMRRLAAPSSELSARVRFMVLDVLDLREKNWASSNKNAPKTLDELRREQERAEAEAAARERERRATRGPPGRYRDERPSRDERPHREERPSREERPHREERYKGSAEHKGDVYRGSSEAFSRSVAERSDRLDGGSGWESGSSTSRSISIGAAPKHFTSAAAGQRDIPAEASSSSSEWTSAGSGKPTIRPTLLSRSTGGASLKEPAAPSPVVPAVTANRYLALEDDKAEPSTTEHEDEGISVASQQPVQASLNERLRKIVAIADEYFRIDNLADLLEECASIPKTHHVEMIGKLIAHAMEKGRKQVLALKPVLLALDEADALKAALCASFEMLDDLAVDIPSASEYAGFLLAVLLDSKEGDFSSIDGILSGELGKRDPTIVIKTYAWMLSFSSSRRTLAFNTAFFSLVDANGAAALDVLKRILKDRLYAILPELELRSFDDALLSMRARLDVSPDDFFASLKHVIDPAARLNQAHLPVILHRLCSLVFEYMYVHRHTSLQLFRSALDPIVPSSRFLDTPAAVSVLNVLATHYQSVDAIFYESVFRALHSHRLVSASAYDAWRTALTVDKQSMLLAPLTEWIDDIIDRENDGEEEAAPSTANEADSKPPSAVHALTASMQID